MDIVQRKDMLADRNKKLEEMRKDLEMKSLMDKIKSAVAGRKDIENLANLNTKITDADLINSQEVQKFSADIENIVSHPITVASYTTQDKVSTPKPKMYLRDGSPKIEEDLREEDNFDVAPQTRSLSCSNDSARFPNEPVYEGWS